MSGDCNACINGKLPSDSPTCVECGLSRKNFKPTTNGDRIRSMSDEELAKLFWIRADCRTCPNKADHCLDDCRGAWLDWLKQEANEKESAGA